jgi:hypothetical protein
MKKLSIAMPHLKVKSRGRLFGFGTSPDADWKTIFISAAVLTLVVIVLSTYMFIKINKGEIFLAEPTGNEGKAVLNTELLRETVSYYQNKALEFERIKSATTTGSIDPSL